MRKKKRRYLGSVPFLNFSPGALWKRVTLALQGNKRAFFFFFNGALRHFGVCDAFRSKDSDSCSLTCMSRRPPADDVDVRAALAR